MGQLNADQIVDQKIDDIVQVCTKLLDNTESPTKPEQLSVELSQELRSQKEALIEQIELGLNSLYSELGNPNYHSAININKTKVIDELKKMLESIAIYNQTPELLNKEVESNQPLYKIFGLTSDSLSYFYEVAFNQLQVKNQDAIHSFKLLCLLAPTESRFWYGLGVSQQVHGFYEKALEAYAICVVMDTSNVRPHFRSAECYIALKESNQALWAIELALHYGSSLTDFEEIKKEAAQLHQILKTL